MTKKISKKAISILCALLIAVSATLSGITPLVSAAGTITQGFETGFNATKGGFSLYEAASNGDTNVKSGSKSLKWTATSGSNVISLYSAGNDLTVGETYKMEAWIKAETSTDSAITFTQLSDKNNGWSYDGAKEYTLKYFGTDYDSVGQWKKFEVTFVAERQAMGIRLYGTDNFYFDDITWTHVNTNVEVTVVTNNGVTVAPLTGAEGSPLALPTLSKDGFYFAGWYTDSDFKTPLGDSPVFPSANITVYAKWSPTGAYVQSFENFTYANGDGFSLYEATSAEDTNVRDGSKSLKWTATSGTKAISLYSVGNELTVGETYKMEAWIKAETSTDSAITFTQLNDYANGWSYDGAKEYTLKYFGTDYDSVGQWKKFEVSFVAEKQAMGIKLYGADNFYFDDITWTQVNADVEVTVVTNNGETVQPLLGADGMPLTLPTLTKEGYYFAGWYKDADFTEGFNNTTFPSGSTTIYAKWIENGLITQDFENYKYNIANSEPFSIYTATDANDTNVAQGKHSLYRNNTTSATRVVSLTDDYTTLTVGKAYKLTYKLKVTNLGTGGGLGLTNLTDKPNPWSYISTVDLGYIGSTYEGLNEWVERKVTFIAEAPYFGLSNWGDITYYIDDLKIVEVPIVTVSFEMGEGEAKAPLTGAAGAALTIENPTPPEGKAFAGWYLDNKFNERYKVSNYPDTDITLYARWVKSGTYEQDYETWPDKKGVYLTSDVFSLYTAKDKNDPNVYSGKHSMHYDNPDSRSTYALGIFDTEMGELAIGEKYYVSIRFKPDKVYSYSTINKTYFYTSIYYTTQQSNVWTHKSQGPIGKYESMLCRKEVTTVKDDYWNGTAGLVTTTTEKDENGWLTMTYEITANAKYIALYVAGQFSMYIDYITIEPLPSGVLSENYSNPYCEDFYNILGDMGLTQRPNSTEKGIYKLELDPRSDYVFTASLKKGAYGVPKVYLATDSEGKNVVEGTVFKGTGSSYKLYSSRIMTDLSGVYYLVVEGGGSGSTDFFALFYNKYSCEENPNPDYVYVPANYNKLPVKDAAILTSNDASNGTSNDTSNGTSNDNSNDNYSDNSSFNNGDYGDAPITGDNSIILPALILLFTSVLSLFILRKRGACNEK